MAVRKYTVELSSDEARELLMALRGSASPVASELAHAVGELAEGMVDAVVIGSEERLDAEPAVLAIGDLCIDVPSRSVRVAGEAVQLTPKEFDILSFLARNRGIVFSKEEIYRAVWGDEYLLDDSNIMAFVRKLRKKIEPEPDSPRYLLTVWGVGYKMAES